MCQSKSNKSKNVLVNAKCGCGPQENIISSYLFGDIQVINLWFWQIRSELAADLPMFDANTTSRPGSPA